MELDSPEISTKAIAAKTSCTIGQRMAPTTSRRRWDLRSEKESMEIIAKLGSGEVLRYMDCYTMANSMLWLSVDMNIIHISTNRCLIVRTKEWVKSWRGGKGIDFQAYIHPAGQSVPPTEPLHNLYDTRLSSASSIWGIKPVATLVQIKKREFLLSPTKNI